MHSAKDHLTGSSVAINKVMKPFGTPKLLKNITHENIISLSDVFICLLEDIYFITELLGTDLHQALAHEYVSPYHDPTDEPVVNEKFDWSFNDADLPVDTWKVMMYSEILDQIISHQIGDNVVDAGSGPTGPVTGGLPAAQAIDG
ncbi:MAPK protein hog1 [Tulasnella sp. 330]|nr:MAPK protein hog1 [Tulasnella sp. 330]KAG8871781.1 MAPK protein hog1 [Tulasnella sp. 331]